MIAGIVDFRGVTNDKAKLLELAYEKAKAINNTENHPWIKKWVSFVHNKNYFGFYIEPVVDAPFIFGIGFTGVLLMLLFEWIWVAVIIAFITAVLVGVLSDFFISHMIRYIFEKKGFKGIKVRTLRDMYTDISLGW